MPKGVYEHKHKVKYWTDKKRSKKTKQKISEVLKKKYKKGWNAGFQKGHGSFWTEESRKKVKQKLIGRKITWADKISKAQRGKRGNNWKGGKPKCKLCKKELSLWHPKLFLCRDCLKEDKHYSWKGNKVGYGALHEWVRKKLGKPQICSHCGSIDKRLQWANINKKYKRNIKDWVSLCISCHKKHDLELY